MEGFSSGPVTKVDFCPELAKKASWRVRTACQTAAVVMSGDGVITGVYMLDRQECYAELARRGCNWPSTPALACTGFLSLDGCFLLYEQP
jgi:hypothetical protein